MNASRTWWCRSLGLGLAVVPDLPYAREDVSGDSEGLKDGRFAMVGSALRRIQSASGCWGFAAARRVAVLRLGTRLSLTALAVSVAAALTVGLLAPAASAESLSDRRAQVAQQLARSKAELNESSDALLAAGAALQRAQGQLEVARLQLAQTRGELGAARKRDAALAKRLTKVRAELAAAKAAVVAGQKAVDKQKVMAAHMVRDQYQQQTNLLPIAVLLQSSSTADLQTRLQWSTTMFDTTSATIETLNALQAKLTAQKARQAELTRQVGDDRQQAQENLDLKKSLEFQSATQAANVGRLVAQRRSVESAAASEVARDKTRYARLDRERAKVEQRIATPDRPGEGRRRSPGRSAAGSCGRHSAACGPGPGPGEASQQGREEARPPSGTRTRAGTRTRTRAGTRTYPRWWKLRHLRLPGVGADYVTVWDAAAPGHRRVEAPRRHRLCCRLRHHHPGAVLRAGG